MSTELPNTSITFFLSNKNIRCSKIINIVNSTNWDRSIRKRGYFDHCFFFSTKYRKTLPAEFRSSPKNSLAINEPRALSGIKYRFRDCKKTKKFRTNTKK